ncbi:hypothetical protein QEN19_002980 [Hanseniaspora menglaensis]
MLYKHLGFVAHILVLCFATFSKAVFSDEAYVKDWHLESIGNGIKHILPSKRGDVLIFLSFDNILSYLNIENGDIVYKEELFSKSTNVVYKISNDDLVAYNPDNSSVEKIINLEDGLEKVVDIVNFEISAYTDIELATSKKCSLFFDENLNQFSLKIDEQEDKQINFGYEFNTNSTQDLSIKYIVTDLKINQTSVVITDTSSNVIHFLQFYNKKLISSWERDNSVADIIAFTIIDANPSLENLPKDFFSNTDVNDVIEVLSNYINRVKTSLQTLKNYIFIEKKLKWTSFILDFFAEDKSVETVAKRDLEFGFNKYFIAVNSDGFIVCINMNNGDIVWKFKEQFDSEITGIFSNLENNLVAVSESGYLYSYSFKNPKDLPVLISKDLLDKSFNAKVQKATNLGAENILIEYDNGEKEILFASENYKPTDDDVIIKFDSAKNKLQAYSGATLTKSWSYTGDSDNVVVAFANKEFDEQTSNIAITYGKKSLLKFLYHQLLAVAIYNKSTQSLSIDILDTKTGSLIKSIDLNEQDVVDLKSPINLLFGEHWLVFSYKSLNPVAEQKIGIVELYKQKNDVAVDKKLNSFEYDPEPEFSLNSYIIAENIDSLSLTKTKYGVSSKNIIIKLANGQISTIPKFILNSRRKEEKSMTDEDKLEPFMQPYYQVIPINDQFVVTHERNLLSTKENFIFSLPTNMESTTYICDLNRVDLFCTKFAPSGEFDILQSNFQRNQVIFTITVLAIVFLFVHPMIKKRKLALKYYID